MEAQLLATDDQFLRLHGVPAGRALDLFGRTLGAAEGDSQDAPRSGRHPVAKLPPSASALRCAAAASLVCCIPRRLRAEEYSVPARRGASVMHKLTPLGLRVCC